MTADGGSAADFFDARADVYDSLIRRGAPCYEEMLAELIAWVPSGATRVLELGCGTGALTLRLADRCPDAALTVVDAAPEMIEIAKKRVASPNATFVTSTRFEIGRTPTARNRCAIRRGDGFTVRPSITRAV